MKREIAKGTIDKNSIFIFMGKFKTFIDFILNGVWRINEQEMTQGRRFGYKFIKSLILSIKGFINDRLNVRANALTYSLMFAAVPIMALMIAIARGFGMEASIEDVLNHSFLGQTNLVPTIMEFVHRYLETAQGGVFIGIGFIILLWSIWAFFNNVEIAFNDIWQVKKNRNPLRQIITYIAILFFVPVLIIVSSGLSLHINDLTKDIAFFQYTAFFKELLIKIIPFVLCWLVFTWMYWAVPNIKVRLWSCLIPGVLIGTLYQLLQMLTVWLFMFFARTSVVYGAFAAIPLILIWFQLACLFILYGAELSYAIQNNENFNYENDIKVMSRRYKDGLTLFIVYKIVKRFENEEPPLTANEISVQNKIPHRLVNTLLSRLVETKIVNEIYIEGKQEKTYQPAIDINKLTVGKVFHHIDRQGHERFLQNPPKERELFWQKFIEVKDMHCNLDEILVKDFMNELPQEDTPIS